MPKRLNFRERELVDALSTFEIEAWTASEAERMNALNTFAERLGRHHSHDPSRSEHHNYLLGVIRHYFNLIGKA